MDHVTTLPRRTWTERASLALAVILIAVGVASILGWLLHLDRLVEPMEHMAPIMFNEGLCFLAIGLALLGREFGIANAAWAGLVPAVIGLLTAFESFFGLDLRIDELFARDVLLVDTVQPGRGSVMAACCIAVAGATVFWRVTERRARGRLFAEAVSGSVLASVGFSTLLGYPFQLPAVYNWGTNTAMSAVTAAALLVAGMALLTLAWRESQKEEGGPPAWLPMPAVVVSLTMTLIFWIGLQEREMAYLDASTMNASDQIATNVKSAVDQQMNALDRLARNEADNPDTNMAAWTIDAASFFDESKELGCVSISLIDAAGQKLTSRWVYPDQGSAASAGFDHSMDPRRREAIEAARTANAPEVTTTPDSDGKGNPGFSSSSVYTIQPIGGPLALGQGVLNAAIAAVTAG